MFVIDKSSRLIKITFIFVCIFSLIFIYKAFCLQKLNFFEFYVILLITILSSLLLICSYDLLTIYLLLEMQALCFYVLASFKRTSSFSTESGLKYFILGSIISCFFLLGLSILYGALGTLNLHYLNLLTSFLFSEYIINFLLVGIFFITITFLFKLAVVPFHF
jgi:NADH:ubiquinone oxidoreductase subunit 2 (subunit N)